MPPPQTYPSSRHLCSCRTRVVVQRGSGGLDLFERIFFEIMFWIRSRTMLTISR